MGIFIVLQLIKAIFILLLETYEHLYNTCLAMLLSDASEISGMAANIHCFYIFLWENERMNEFILETGNSSKTENSSDMNPVKDELPVSNLSVEFPV